MEDLRSKEKRNPRNNTSWADAFDQNPAAENSFHREITRMVIQR